MKLRSLIALLIVFFILTGCKSNAKTVSVNLKSISFSADVMYYNENYSCDCDIDSAGSLSVDVTSPENLKGLLATFNGDCCKVSFNGIEIENAEHFLPHSFSFNTLNGVLKACEKTDCEQQKKNLTINGEFDGKKFTMYASPSGLPISLKIPDMGMTVSFKNVTVINS